MAKKIEIKVLSHEEKLQLLDKLIDRDAAMWKEYIRESDGKLADFFSRVNDSIILYPRQR